MSWSAMLIVLLALMGTGMLVSLCAKSRWNSGTMALRARLEATRVATTPGIFNVRELEGLPLPVKRYFRTVLRPGQPIVLAVSVVHEGTLNVGQTSESWKSFTSTQRVITHAPGFDWAARVSMMPGLSIFVHDAYIAGEGMLHASILGLVTLAKPGRTADLARGELMRFLAEAAWYPTALLPSQGVHWQAVDAQSAQATLHDKNITLTLLYHFNEQGLIDSVLAQARGRLVRGKVLKTPWKGRFWNYAMRNGMRVPLDAEVSWLLPEGAEPYWRGHISSLEYEFASQAA